MTKNVGVLAAMTLSTLGTASEVYCFFNLITWFLEGGVRASVYPSITERLYRNSIEYSELADLKNDLTTVKKKFEKILTVNVDKALRDCDPEGGRLNWEADTLGRVFLNYFDRFFDAVESTEVFLEEFAKYVPVRIGFTDVPFYIYDVKRNSEDYDRLAGDDLPYWLR